MNIRKLEDVTVENSSQAKIVLKDYLTFIKEKKFNSAFTCVSDFDKRDITEEDFCEWQNLISEFYVLQKFDLDVSKTYEGVVVEGCLFEMVEEIFVVTKESTIFIRDIDKSEVVKIVVLEEGQWKIFLGLKDLKLLIKTLKLMLNEVQTVLNDCLKS